MSGYFRTMRGALNPRAAFVGAAQVALLVLLIVWPNNLMRVNSASAAVISGEIDPSEVYALWQEINSAILIYARLAGADDVILVELETIEPRPYTAKQPSDVYEQVNIVRGKLDAVLGNWLVPNYQSGMLLEGEIIRYMTLDGVRVTPLTVYLRSLFIQESLTKSIVSMNPDYSNVSGFFDQEIEEGRRPGDVYGLVLLALARIDILAKWVSESEVTHP